MPAKYQFQSKLVKTESISTQNSTEQDVSWSDSEIHHIASSKMLRFSIRGISDSYIAFAEGKDHQAKRITYALGCLGDSYSAPAWVEKGHAGI